MAALNGQKQGVWLKNRQKHNWRDKQEHGFTDLDGKDILLGYGKEDDD